MCGTRTHRPLQRFPDLPKHLFQAARQRVKRQKANAEVLYVMYIMYITEKFLSSLFRLPPSE